MAKLKVVGFDPSLRNWGVANGTFCTITKRIQIESMDVIQPVLPSGKQTRQNSKDLAAAVQLTHGAVEASRGAHAIFVEVPVGSQSARAMAGYAICVGVLGALRAGGIQYFEVTPTEVKVVATGRATATKKEMIEWAKAANPEIVYPTYIKQGRVEIVEGKAEHMADAVGAIHAGVKTDPFLQLMQIHNYSKEPVCKSF